jgi:DNA-binding NarL/FixJ family response regulator
MLGQWHVLQSAPWPENARHVLALATHTAATSSRRASGPATFRTDDDREQRRDDDFELHWTHIRDGLRELTAMARPARPPDSDALFSAFVAGGDHGSRRALIAWLTRMGADPVHEAATVDEAKAHTRVSGPCHLALVDLDLPHGGGLELVTDLRLLGWRRIVVLASPDDPAVPLAFRAGAQACLLKFAPPGELRLVPADTMRPNHDTATRTRPRPAAHHNNNPYRLSAREIEVLQLVAAGHSNKEIGETLNLSALTIRSHLTRTGRKLGTGDRAQMVAHAMRARIIH